LNTPWQQKVFTKLIGFQYKIVYKQSSENSVADALSRRAHSDGHLLSISSCSPTWLQEVLQSYQNDEFASSTIAKLSVDSAAVPNYTLIDGILRYKNNILVGSDLALQHKLISALHNSIIGGHSGVLVTLRRLQQYFAW